MNSPEDPSRPVQRSAPEPERGPEIPKDSPADETGGAHPSPATGDSPRPSGTDSRTPDGDRPATGGKAPGGRPPGSTGGGKYPTGKTGPSGRPDDTHETTGKEAGSGRTAAIWVALVLGAIVLVLLLIFILQNNDTAHFEYLGGQFELPLGVAMLLAAIAGALIMALVGSVRMIQMSLTIRKLRKRQEKMQQLAGK